MSNSYDITSVSKRLFTADEIADKARVHRASVFMYARKLSLPFVKGEGKTKLFPYTSMRAILDALIKTADRRSKKTKGISASKEELAHIGDELASTASHKEKPREECRSLEELRRLHPLVTDDRCFDINWWPDPRPMCFDDGLDKELLHME